jgi:hypothetical protein
MAEGRRGDAAALAAAGLVNAVLAPLDYALLLKPGAVPSGRTVGDRAHWIAAHHARWQGGWAFWFVVTTTFAWSYFALGRHLRPRPPWPALAVGLALIAAAVDLVGVVANIAVLPALAGRGGTGAFEGTQLLAHALTDFAALGIYTAAGLLLLPALRRTPGAPRALWWLGVAEWGVSTVATALLVFDVPGATAAGTASFLLYAPWTWVAAWWVLAGHGQWD